MQKITLFVAVAALGVAAWQTLEASTLRDDLTRQREEISTLTANLSTLQRDVAAGNAEILPMLDEPVPTDGSNPTAEEGADPALRGAPVTTQSVLRALKDMQAEVKRQKETIAELSSHGGQTRAPRQIAWRGPTMINDAKSAADVLKLDSGQQAELDRIVEDTKARIDDLRRIPNNEGKTWADVSKSRMEVATSGENNIALMMSDFKAIQQFRNSKVPGTDETYGQAENRIRNDGKARVRDMLSNDQRQTWDDAHTDPLFGGGGPGIVLSAFATTTDSAESTDR